MCDCGENVRVSEYQNETVVNFPFEGVRENKEICIDTCILEEIENLWSLGIVTTGCCCGHNYMLPFIGVIDDHIDTMIEMGYIIQVNPNGRDNLLRKDSFYPKSIKMNSKMYDDYLEHLYRTNIK